MFESLVRHHFGRFQGQFGTHAAKFGYFYLVPMLVLPWTPFVGAGLWRLVRSGEYRDRRWMFLACWFVPGMALLSWSSFKAKHYTIPLLPPLAVLAAVGWFEVAAVSPSSERCGRVRRCPCSWWSGAWPASWPWSRAISTAMHAVAALLGLMLVGLLVMFYFEWRRQAVWQLTALFATAWLVAVGEHLFVMPVHDSYRAQAELADNINHVVPSGQSLYMLELPDNQITYYLHPQVVRLDLQAEFTRDVSAAAGESTFVLAPLRVAEKLRHAGEVQEIARCSQINSYLTEADRLTFFRFKRAETAQCSPAPGVKKLE